MRVNRLFPSYGMEDGRSEQSKASYPGKDPEREGMVGFRVRVYWDSGTVFAVLQFYLDEIEVVNV